jgi:midasin
MDLIRGIGQMFNLTRENIDHLALERFPSLNKTRDAVKVGRTTVPRKAVAETKTRRPFYLTRQASRLLEFLATAITNREPLLLVGETGVGKTSAVQYLCDLLGKKLVTVNLNQQTESADLLGGFKPVDFEHFVLPVRQQFESLFRRTFSSKENAKFMTHLSECQSRKRWSDLVQLMIHACKGGLKKDILNKEWKVLEQQLDQLKKSVTTQAKLLFSFVNGALTDAVQVPVTLST